MQQPGRMRLRQWLEEQIHSGRYPGVSWLDQSAQIFQIPWKHAARHGWSIDRDATLFRNWAVHTGRYRPDKDKPDPKTWKANFRCALNSLPDICELPEHSRKSGRNAFRVYRMMPNTPTHRRRRDLRSLSRPRRRQVSLGDGAYVTHPWQTTTAAMSDASQMLETPAGDMFGSTPAQGMWETHPEDQELTDAVVKLMDNSSSADLWSQTGEQRGWRTHTLMDQWHSAGDAYSLHVDSYSDLLGPNYVKELCDWSTPHETLMS